MIVAVLQELSKYQSIIEDIPAKMVLFEKILELTLW